MNHLLSVVRVLGILSTLWVFASISQAQVAEAVDGETSDAEIAPMKAKSADATPAARESEAAKDSDEPSEQPTLAENKDWLDPALPDADHFEVHLSDGSCLCGKLDAGEVIVETQYGDLTVPVLDVVRLTPGLKTRGKLYKRLQQLLDDLDNEDFSVRDKAQAELKTVGPATEQVLRELADADNTEQITRLKAVFDEFEAQKRTWGAKSVVPLHKLDSVTTGEFTVRGEIKARQINVKGLFGDVSIPLSAVSMICRGSAPGEGERFNKLKITPGNMVEVKPLRTDTLVRRGDLVSIKAEGTIRRTSSSSYTSTPDGSSRLGTVQTAPKIYGGMLLVRIGNDGEFVPAGSSHTFTADTNGKLQLGIAMSNSYAYRYTYEGEYEVQIRVSRN